MKAEELKELVDELDVLRDGLTHGYHQAAEANIDFDLLAQKIDAAASAHPLNAQGLDAVSFLERKALEVKDCVKCKLADGRRNAVFGEGVAKPLVLVIGEGPGADEDNTGRPFVGPAGQLLDKMLAAIDLSREKNCYIANVVKCRPPQNREPDLHEINSCLPYLHAQINFLLPKFILCVGRTALHAIAGRNEGINALRGKWLDYQGIPLIATFHPSAILRDESLKRPAWEDLKLLKAKIENS